VPTGRVAIDSISSEWRPQRTISRFVNSSSRLEARGGHGAGMWAYLAAGWNGTRGPNSPRMFYGVIETDAYDAEGYRIYKLSDEASRLGNATQG
jgi:hypothetical protein